MTSVACVGRLELNSYEARNGFQYKFFVGLKSCQGLDWSGFCQPFYRCYTHDMHTMSRDVDTNASNYQVASGGLFDIVIDCI